MKIALLGYGRMGKAIELLAIERGHDIVAKIDQDQTDGNLSDADVAINFSIPEAAVENIKTALKINMPVGLWNNRMVRSTKRSRGFL